MTMIWRGDDLGAWHGMEAFDKSRVTIVDVQRGGRAVQGFRFHVKPTDIVQNGVRAELLRDDARPEGSERFESFSVFFPRGFFPTAPKAWQVFHQYHQSYRDGATVGRSPPVEFALNGDTMQLNVNDYRSPSFTQKTLWSKPMQLDTWYDFILHAKWSSNPTVGFLRLFLNGTEVLPRTAAMTMFPGYGVYMKTGIYRARTIVPDATLYQRGFAEATTLDELLQSTPIEPSTPTPIPTPPSAPIWTAGAIVGRRTLMKNGQVVGTLDDAVTTEVLAALSK